MKIHRIPVLSDNYIFLLVSAETGTAAVVDPAVAEPVLQLLQELKLELVAIFNTHHHRDHVGGNAQLLHQFPQAIAYGGAEDRGRIPGQQVFLKEGDRVSFANREAQVLFVPGHTKAHIAYYFPPSNLPPSGFPSSASLTSEPNEIGELFCGDTLFAGSCGRLFEGTPAQMVDSLGKIRALPDSTRVWCAHEYTLSNLRFAVTVEENNQELQARLDRVKAMRQRSEATIPSLLGEEKATNPFLRWDRLELQARVKSQNPIQTFGRLRGMKDVF